MTQRPYPLLDFTGYRPLNVSGERIPWGAKPLPLIFDNPLQISLASTTATAFDSKSFFPDQRPSSGAIDMHCSPFLTRMKQLRGAFVTFNGNLNVATTRRIIGKICSWRKYICTDACIHIPILSSSACNAEFPLSIFPFNWRLVTLKHLETWSASVLF